MWSQPMVVINIARPPYKTLYLCLFIGAAYTHI